MSSIERKLSVAEAYHEFTLETSKEKSSSFRGTGSKLFQCGVCLENNTRRYMLCCEGTTKSSSYICSGCWVNWFGNQQKVHCPFPYCKEKILKKPLTDVGGHRTMEVYECPCCGKQHRDEVHRVRDRGLDISFHGAPPSFNVSEAIDRIKTMVRDLPQDSGMVMGMMKL